MYISHFKILIFAQCSVCVCVGGGHTGQKWACRFFREITDINLMVSWNMLNLCNIFIYISVIFTKIFDRNLQNYFRPVRVWEGGREGGGVVSVILPGGRLEHPVVNCKKAFLSASVKLTKTLTNFWKAGDSLVYPNFGSVNLTISSRVKTGLWSPHNMDLTSLGLKGPNFSIGKTKLKPLLKASICFLMPLFKAKSNVKFK